MIACVSSARDVKGARLFCNEHAHHEVVPQPLRLSRITNCGEVHGQPQGLRHYLENFSGFRKILA
jgi:hypothetical protein